MQAGATLHIPHADRSIPAAARQDRLGRAKMQPDNRTGMALQRVDDRAGTRIANHQLHLFGTMRQYVAPWAKRDDAAACTYFFPSCTAATSGDIPHANHTVIPNAGDPCAIWTEGYGGDGGGMAGQALDRFAALNSPQS